MTTTIYSDGKEYPVIFRPAGVRCSRSRISCERDSASTSSTRPAEKKWPGGVQVWLSDDARRIPFRIEITESLASMQLDCRSIEACAFYAEDADEDDVTVDG